MRPELADALQLALAASLGAIAHAVRQVAMSRKSQGERLGSLEDRISKLEGIVSGPTKEK